MSFPRLARLSSRRATVLIGAVALTAAGGVIPAPAAAATAFLPAPRSTPASIDSVDYVGQNSCDPSKKSGVQQFAALLKKYHPSVYSGINRVCQQGHTSEHKEGRAIDWMVGTQGGADASAMISWLRAKDSRGNTNAMARRTGVMYLIWDNKFMPFYGRTAGQWEPYNSCAKQPQSRYDTSCHRDHVHMSFTWAGAMGRTSYYSGSVAATDYGPCRADGLNWAPQYYRARTTPCPQASWPVPTATSAPYMANLRYWSGVYLQEGWDSPAVTPVRQALGLSASSTFDSATTSAVKSYQRTKNLSATGVMDRLTWRTMLGSPAPRGVSKPSSPAAPATSAKSYASPAFYGGSAYLRHAGATIGRHGVSGGSVATTAEGLGGSTTRAAAVTGYAGKTVVAVRGSDGNTYIKMGKGGSWGGWHSVGGKTPYYPAVATDSTGMLHIFVTGSNRAVYELTLKSGKWSGWHALSGRASASPAATAIGRDVELVVRGTDNSLYRGRLSGSRFDGFHVLGGRSTSAPAVTDNNGAVLYAVRGKDGSTWFRTASRGWRSLGGRGYNAPAATAAGSGFMIGLRGTDNLVYTRTGSTSWSGWKHG